MNFTDFMSYDDVAWVKGYRKLGWWHSRSRRVWRHARFLRFELRWLRWCRKSMPLAHAYYMGYNDTDGRFSEILARHP
jgi:hypothetical protein